MNTLLCVLASRGNTYCTRENIVPSGQNSSSGQNDVKRMARNVSGKQTELWKTCAAEAIINSSQNYREALERRRIEAQNNALNVQKQKYHYKNMSSNIIRCKTSTSAKQVVSQAKRELQKLKKAKATGKYDNEEIDAAIAHAKAMERIARKKVRHLEEEEMAKASGKGKVEEFVEDSKEAAEEAESRKADEEEEAAEEASENPVPEEYESYEAGDFSSFNVSQLDVSDFTSEAEFNDFVALMESMTSEMLDEMTASMEEMMEDMNLEELSESLLAATGKMDDNDIKMMEIVHRNKEMKEITKANVEYLKALFEHYQSLKSSGAMPAGAQSTPSVGSLDTAFTAPTQVSAPPPAAAPATIDIAL